MKRIGFVSHRFQLNDGQGRVNYEVVQAALARGYRVTLIATHCAEELASHPHAQFVHAGTDRLPTELLRNLVFAFSSAHWLRRHRGELDLLQVNGFVTWEQGDIAAAHFVHSAWRRSPYYPFRSWTPYSLYQRAFSSLNCRWEKIVFRGARLVIAVSQVVAREVEGIGVPAERIAVIVNGVDTKQFFPGPAERERFGLPTGVPLALFAGDVKTSRKNLETVLQAMQQIPKLHLAVAGRVKGSSYPAMATDLGMSDRVHFLDKVGEMAVLMRSVDVFLFPSRYEPFGLVVLEAMASGVPVVVSERAGAGAYVGQAGCTLKDPDAVDELVAATVHLLQNPEERKRMALEGRRRAMGMSWEVMAARYLDEYERLTGK